MKLAWIGSPDEGGGVGGMCRLILRELAQAGVEVDVFGQSELIPSLQPLFQNSQAHYFAFPYTWNWDSWYGRNQKLAFIISFLKRLRGYQRLVNSVVAAHRRGPYDAVIQFSQGELFRLGKYAEEIPIILFPCVHAAGEWHWCRQEEALARRCEAKWWRVARDLYLGYRARLQKRDYHRVRGVIGMSRRFNDCVRRDYGLAAERQGVVYQPMDVPTPVEINTPPTTERTVRLLFVGRISVRKGLELLLEVIPPILCEDREVELTLIGAGSLWSNYEPLLADLPRERCRWLKSLPNDEVVSEMQRSDILLVPSQYEPGGIVVGEALSNGMIVVASDEVGSAENLPECVCQEFRAGNLNGFREATLRAIAAVRTHGPKLRIEAAATAKAQFDATHSAKCLLSEVRRLLGVRMEPAANFHPACEQPS